MPTIQERHRNNVKAGIFVTVSIILAMAVVATLKNAWDSLFVPRHRYAVTFPVASGVQSLKPGSVVRVGGMDMGRVTRVVLYDLLDGDRPLPLPPSSTGSDSASSTKADADPAPPKPYSTIVVFFEIDPNVPLYSNAQAFVKTALIGADAWIEIMNVGHARSDDPDDPPGRALAPNDLSVALVGQEGGTLLASVLGPTGADKTNAIIDDIKNFTPALAKFGGHYDEKIVPMFDDAGAGIAEFRALAERLNVDWARWAFTVDDTLQNVLLASGRLDLLIEDGRLFMADARGVAASARGVIDDNRPDMDAMIRNLATASGDVQQLAHRLASGTIDKVDAFLDRGRDGMDSFSRVAAKLELEFDALAPVLQDSMASFNNAATQLSLATAEIRSSPWRLLYRPNEKELDHENLYFAATKFMLAVSELKVASQSVDRAIANHRAYLAEHPAELEELQKSLARSMTNYVTAQERLLSILNQGGRP
ncbi:MAG: hypothetical protein HRU76_15910 [Phycisphaeraceae bacterium]|nr:hypothetical protein [Phycisphaerales bacterium]QOJ18980.1 MAG: hypothetical protein HRU76_15910 [Phycisphaeraceae bacterium]